MTPEAFRKDKYLRAAGYNFYVWAVVNLLVTLPLYAALRGSPWPDWIAGLFPLGLIAAGLFVCGLNDNRVQKLVGDPAPAAVVEACSIWGPIFLAGLMLSVVLSARGPAAYIQPLWLCLVGAAYWIWGNFGVREFRWLGGFLIAAGVVAGFSVHPEAPLRLASPTALRVWIISMGIVWFPVGAFINRKYLHSGPGG